jgi:phosphoglycerate kinase
LTRVLWRLGAELLRCLLAVATPERCLVCGDVIASDDATASGDVIARAPSPAPGLRPWHPDHLCRACFDILAAGGPVAGRLDGRPLHAAMPESAALVRLVGQWKYHGARGLGRPLAALLTPALRDARAAADLHAASLVPVPLHARRRRERGFDQTAQLAGLVGAASGLPCRRDVLRRARDTAQQASHGPAGSARARNVARAFTARPPEAEEPRDLVLLDDLVTSGATVRAATAALTGAGWRVAAYVAVGRAARLGGDALDIATRPSVACAANAITTAPHGARGSAWRSSEGGSMKKASLSQLDPRDHRVLMRVDFNVPLDANQTITDDTRIRAALPSIQHILDGGGSVVLMSHLGRPKGQIKPEYSLRPVADRLTEHLTAPVKFATDTVGPDAQEKAAGLQAGEVLLLENLRFDAGETGNDADFARALAKLGDVYANDAFGTAHRAHASTVGAAEHFDRRYAGLLMEKELEHLGVLLHEPPRPFAAILGGAKVDSKVDVIRNLLDRVDHLLLGGGMIFTFFKVMGLNIGDSLLDEPSLPVAEEILARARESGTELVLPTDVTVATDFADSAEHKDVLVTDIPDGWQGLDIGPQTTTRFAELIAGARAVFWNGPMGVFEMPTFAVGTRKVGEAIAAATDGGALSVVGGGDSVAALNQMDLADRISHVSTGGGASLEFMAGQELPGVAALSDA